MSNDPYRPCPRCGSKIMSHILTLPMKKFDRYCFRCENCGHIWTTTADKKKGGNNA